MATRKMLVYPYHLPPLNDNSSPNKDPDVGAQYCVDRIYLEQNSTFDFERDSSYEYMKVYPTEHHPKAPHPYSISEIFNEGEQIWKSGPGSTIRNVYELHRDWRQVPDIMTTIVGYREVVTYRPIFATKFSFFAPNNAYDTVTIKQVWAYIYLLLDIVLESVSTKLLSAEFSTKSACEHAEQVLVGIGASVKPLVELYGDICSSEVFSRLIGRVNVLDTRVCTFATMADIVADEGGLFIFNLVKDFILQAIAAISKQIELDVIGIVGSYDICTICFPKPFEYQWLLLPELEQLAFNPLVDDLFALGTMKKKLNTLMRREYAVVAPARIRLYCCSGVRMLTDSVFNIVSYDTVAHGYSKRNHHLTLAVEVFSLASTVILFYLHAIRTGVLAGQIHPVIDPDFSIRGANGEFSPIFLEMWELHADTLRYFGKVESGIAEPDFPSEAVPLPAGSLAPEGSHSPSPNLRKQRSVVNLVSMGYLNREKPAPPAGASPSASGSPASLSPGPLAGPGSTSPILLFPSLDKNHPTAWGGRRASVSGESMASAAPPYYTTQRDGHSPVPLVQPAAVAQEQDSSSSSSDQGSQSMHSCVEDVSDTPLPSPHSVEDLSGTDSRQDDDATTIANGYTFPYRR
ncbi:hypothetical protein HYPSUDRAFT_197182 [Hypholoma sublateritium FD-334 SS-4]|uniref:Uncharacterized protein n=1 Tax=Hypholoma sublateritium (strain FD-334 SS-4) TaxID=945553 RepID=A0A0D2PIJ3_HYPSF|nr:hypothetical protein HYPSUDRAFT_197182 [Hypholoma sublateritium FD-334 SS-4]